MNTKQEQVLNSIRSFTRSGFLPTRQTLAASLSWPINQVTGRVRELLMAGKIVEEGTVFINASRRSRALLKAV